MTSADASSMRTLLERQKMACICDGLPSTEQRIERLNKAIDLLITHSDALCAAMRDDFGHRSMDASLAFDIGGSIDALKYAKRHLRKWMRPEKRSPQFPLGLFGAKASVRYQPKGVVGIISPWNFPVNLAFAPLAGVLAAGNRAMIKPSEFTEQTSGLMAELIGQYYQEDEVAVVTGGPEIGAAFSELPFDHLVFTGATSVARHVMRAAAENLVPLTLELGGKSPVIVGNSADMQKVALRTMTCKTLNAGQICLAPDYVLLPEGKANEFATAAKSAIETMYPSGVTRSDDYTAVINERHYNRLQACAEDARNKGAKIVDLDSSETSTDSPYRMPPALVLEPEDDMQVMQDEIFGPLLPVKTYSSIEQAIAYINARPRPLAVYYFGDDTAEQDRVLTETVSGGATINDVLFHIAQEDLPFGGIGPSGMGCYHGKDGFNEFSHRKAVYTQTKADLMSVLRPPYGEKFRKLMGSRLKH
ncbi:MAG: coniferyl aldehyde dehydrogenase [Gammaproteobacteria bacterium]|nr:coniferyl aldehyde dehydrogenase [Gammaproteobacteria bacterium]